MSRLMMGTKVFWSRLYANGPSTELAEAVSELAIAVDEWLSGAEWFFKRRVKAPATNATEIADVWSGVSF